MIWIGKGAGGGGNSVERVNMRVQAASVKLCEGCQCVAPSSG